MNFMVLVLLGVVAAAVADSPAAYYYSAPQEPVEESEESVQERQAYTYSAPEDYSEEYDDAKYDFDWSVKDEDSGNDFGHQESRDGDNTKGSYYVQLPDGRLQTVTYYLDGDSGYVAEVSYEGEAQYPESSEYRQYEPPTPRYTASEPEESEEALVYTPPRRLYTAPESEESEEAPVYQYTPPRRQYFAPLSSLYSAP